MASSTESTEVTSSVSKLTIDPTKKTPKTQAKKKVADSWEDEDVTSGSEDGDSRPSTSGLGVKEGTTAPPPTPISPNYNISQPFSSSATALSLSPDAGAQSRRPEKTDAVARRMITNALGVKTPKQTEEQKAYDKAIREKERKRRDDERAADRKKQEDVDKAKKAVWDD